MSEDLPDRMPDGMSEDMPDRMSEDMPDRISNKMPNKMPEDLPDRMPDGMNWMPWWGSLEAKLTVFRSKGVYVFGVAITIDGHNPAWSGLTEFHCSILTNRCCEIPIKCGEIVCHHCTGFRLAISCCCIHALPMSFNYWSMADLSPFSFLRDFHGLSGCFILAICSILHVCMYVCMYVYSLSQKNYQM